METPHPPELGDALKEWGVVLDALLEGSTILIVRKGGIVEPTPEGFTLLHHRFWVFPTMIHQRDEHLSPPLVHLAADARQRYAGIENVVPFAAVAEVAGAWRVTREGALPVLAGVSPLNETALRERFSFGNEDGLWAVALRVYETARRHEEPYIDLFSGCRSWVELPHALPTGVCHPVLSGEAFTRRLRGVTALMESVNAEAVALP